MNGFDALSCFDLGSYATAKKFHRVRLCSLDEPFGGVETLISQPKTMNHASRPVETRKRLGITPEAWSASVGIEDMEDLIGDLEDALEGPVAALNDEEDAVGNDSYLFPRGKSALSGSVIQRKNGRARSLRARPDLPPDPPTPSVSRDHSEPATEESSSPSCGDRDSSGA